MGDAKRRGTREQRIAQAIERRLAEEQKRLEGRKAAEAEELERIRNLPPEERKERLLTTSRTVTDRRILMAAMAGLLATPLQKR